MDEVSTDPLMCFGFTAFGPARHERHREHAVLAEVTRLGVPRGYERRSVWTLNKRGSARFISITRRRFLGMGAGSTTFAGRDLSVDHSGSSPTPARSRTTASRSRAGCTSAASVAPPATPSGRRTRGRSTNARSAPPTVPPVAAMARAGLAPLACAGLLRREASGDRLTPRGFSLDHDLERLVTDQLIEPLRAEMLVEHARDPGALEGRASWVACTRPGRSWPPVRRLFEKEMR